MSNALKFNVVTSNDDSRRALTITMQESMCPLFRAKEKHDELLNNVNWTLITFGELFLGVQFTLPSDHKARIQQIFPNVRMIVI